MIRLTKDMSRQEVFERLAAASAANLFPAVDKTRRSCRYHADEGLACPIGCFLPDDVAARIDGGLVGSRGWAVRSVGSSEVFDLVAPFLPTWMDGRTAYKIQKLHDASYRLRGSGVVWRHDDFVEELRSLLVGDAEAASPTSAHP